MARMRTVKPEFWEDEVVGSLTRDARLLFIATWNLADDEGLLRWTAPALKSHAFMYDDDVTVEYVASLMRQLEDAGLIFRYVGGKTRQALAYIVQFHRHQRVNRPQPSKLPPPSVQAGATLQMYIARDGGRCHLCGAEISHEHNRSRLWASLDRVCARAHGGTDYPSNIKLAHVSCNKARGERPIESFKGSPATRYHRITVAPISADGPDEDFPLEEEPVADTDAPTDPVAEPFTESVTTVGEGSSRGEVGVKGDARVARDARDATPDTLVGDAFEESAIRPSANGTPRPRPTARTRKHIENAARNLLRQGVPLNQLIISATNLGQTGYHDLTQQVRLDTASRNGHSRASPVGFTADRPPNPARFGTSA